ncbi:hypothetical protein BGW80DRAFT_1188200 [Lactifluus volemus]|nr:hypothetical protein BGW80DRAFT_1188200 [Lactifluus volemus]
MPRCSKDAKKSRLRLENLYRTCCYCNTNRPTNRFDKHLKACKTKWEILSEQRTWRTEAAGPLAEPEAQTSQNEPEFVQGSSAMQVDMSDDLPGPSQSPIGLNATEQPEHPATDLNFPQEYLKIVPHPHSRDPTTQIILLTSSKETLAFQPKPSVRPWAPFKNLVDFEYAETATKGLLSKKLVNTQLARINSTWALGSFLSIKNHRDMERVLSKARTYFVQFKSGTITATYEDQPREITFEYRDPWKWILALIQDESLVPWNMWNAVKKFYCQGDHEERIYDEPNTADVWWEVDVSRPRFFSLL